VSGVANCSTSTKFDAANQSTTPSTDALDHDDSVQEMLLRHTFHCQKIAIAKHDAPLRKFVSFWPFQAQFKPACGPERQ
jgi:hypothetical protein